MSGRLSIYAVSDSMVWHGGVDQGDKYLQLNLDGPEWEVLFFDVLHCPEPEPYVKNEDLKEYDNRFRIKFQQAIPQFPMLARLWDTYQDTGYTPEQVKQLRNECLTVSEGTDNPLALEGLRKMILACDEAIEAGLGLFFVCD